ncbi:MAG: TIGR01906 family membrane protein [Dehalococcoidia bacterium]
MGEGHEPPGGQPLDDAPALDKRAEGEENTAVVAAGRQRETHMGFARTLATVAFIIALPIALLTTNIRVLANAPVVYRYAFDRYNAERSTGLSRADLNSTAAALQKYFNNGETTFYHTVTQDGLKTSVFNARETRHMQDVKRLFVLVNRTQEISVVYLLAYAAAFFIWAREGSVRQLAVQCLLGLALGVLFVGGIGVFAAFGFQAAFERFHTIVFTNNFWQLNPATDHLVQMFPEPFWRDMTVVLGVACAVEALLIGTVSTVYLLGTRGERRRLPSSLAMEHSQSQAA